MLDPDTIDPVPESVFDLLRSKDYWLFWGNTVYNDERKWELGISTFDLADDSIAIGCCITRGDLEFYINRQKRTVGWYNVPMDKPLWGVVWMYGKDRTIQLKFYCAW